MILVFLSFLGSWAPLSCSPSPASLDPPGRNSTYTQNVLHTVKRVPRPRCPAGSFWNCETPNQEPLLRESFSLENPVSIQQTAGSNSGRTLSQLPWELLYEALNTPTWAALASCLCPLPICHRAFVLQGERQPFASAAITVQVCC